MTTQQILNHARSINANKVECYIDEIIFKNGNTTVESKKDTITGAPVIGAKFDSAWQVISSADFMALKMSGKQCASFQKQFEATDEIGTFNIK